MPKIAAGTACPRNDGIDPNSSGLLVIASVAKQSPAWNKYSNYYFLPPEIAAGTACPRNDRIAPNSSGYPN